MRVLSVQIQLSSEQSEPSYARVTTDFSRTILNAHIFSTPVTIWVIMNENKINSQHTGIWKVRMKSVSSSHKNLIYWMSEEVICIESTASRERLLGSLNLEYAKKNTYSRLLSQVRLIQRQTNRTIQFRFRSAWRTKKSQRSLIQQSTTTQDWMDWYFDMQQINNLSHCSRLKGTRMRSFFRLQILHKISYILLRF